MQGHRQVGASLIGVTTVLLIMGGMAFIGIKVAPIYFEFFRVDSAMQKIAEQPEMGELSPDQVKDVLVKRLVIDDIDEIKHKQISIKRESSVMYVNVKYEKRNQALDSLDLVGKYDKTIELKIPEQYR